MYPKMMSEVIEAIETYFCDEPDIVVDCMLYLMNANARVEDVHRIERWFDDNGRLRFLLGSTSTTPASAKNLK